MGIAGVYYIKNKINGKLYIGSSKNIRLRLNGHKTLLRKGKHNNRYLQFAWNRYGKKNFRFGILEKVNKFKIIEREQYWIDYYKTFDLKKCGYNINPKANCSPMLFSKIAKRVSRALKGHIPWNKGKKGSQVAWNKGLKNCYSKETLWKIGSANRGKTGPNKGRKFSKEARRNMSKAHKGIIPWNKGFSGYSTSWKGKKHSLETRRKMSIVAKNRIRIPMSEETKRKIGLANSRVFKRKAFIQKLTIKRERKLQYA